MKNRPYRKYQQLPFEAQLPSRDKSVLYHILGKPEKNAVNLSKEFI